MRTEAHVDPGPGDPTDTSFLQLTARMLPLVVDACGPSPSTLVGAFVSGIARRHPEIYLR